MKRRLSSVRNFQHCQQVANVTLRGIIEGFNKNFSFAFDCIFYIADVIFLNFLQLIRHFIFPYPNKSIYVDSYIYV